MHILTNISRSKGNHAIEFGQLEEYNTRKNFFLKNHTYDVVEKLFPDHFVKKIKIEHISESIV